jgi:hypothetical protein
LGTIKELIDVLGENGALDEAAALELELKNPGSAQPILNGERIGVEPQ